MKPIFLVLICVVIASLAGASAAYFLVENQSDPDSIEENRDIQSAVTNSQQRVFDLETKVARLEKARLESPPLDAQALRNLDDKYRRQISALEATLASLQKSGLGGEVPAGLLASADGGAIDEALNRVVEKAMQKSNKERREVERKRWTPFVKAQMSRQMEKTMKKLNLRPDQEERFEASVNESMDRVMPAMGIVMDPQAGKEDKAAAFTEINRAMESVDNDAKSYMDPTQYSTFAEEQSRQTQQMTRMQSMFGGGAAGGASTGSNGEKL
ncbi:MAG: hypothetical protein ACI97A_001452 [Planctomycetota bacterium]|jgi:hypothetical protein